MKNTYLETRPVEYSLSCIKVLHFTRNAGKRCFRMHWHERIEIMLVKEGELEYICGTNKGLMKKGMALIIPPRIVHYAKALTNCKYDTLMFDVRFFYNETDICKNILPLLFDNNSFQNHICTLPEVLHAIDTLCNKTESDSLKAVSEVYGLLHLFIKNNILSSKGISKPNSVFEITKYMEENFAENITPAQLAEIFGYTAEHLCRKFKKAVGLPPMSYLKIYRLERAYALLKESDSPVSDIAAKCGFYDANYFTRSFKTHFGHPPTYYKSTEKKL